MKQRAISVRTNSEEPAIRKARARRQLVGAEPQSRGPRTVFSSLGNQVISRRVAAGLPSALKASIEDLAGVSMAGVRVHPRSSAPEQHDAHSFTQGDDIHIGPGRDEDLPHEAWHVAQQRQGRVAPTGESLGAPLNHDGRLESEADAMGERASARQPSAQPSLVSAGVTSGAHSPVQLKCRICNAKSHNENNCPKNPNKKQEEKGGGRGLTKANKGQIALFHKILPLLDRESMYDEGAKSLVGGRKGKPNGLSDSSVRIDRQMTGNVQFQIGDDSYGKVSFSPEAKPGAIIAALIDSVNTGEEREVA
jgi:hypothetical protein